MKRDTGIVAAVITGISVAILGSAMLCAWATAHGASQAWRLPFRLICHGLPQRSFETFGTTMPVCARCVGVYVGLLAGLVAFAFLPWVTERVMRGIAMVAVAPLAVDGFTQLLGLRESTNPLRLATGIAAGLAFGMWVLSAVERRHERVPGTS